MRLLQLVPKSDNMEKAFHSETSANDADRLIAKAAQGNRSAFGTFDNRFFSRWVPYVIAACLMILGVSQARQILDLKSQLLAARTDATRLRESNALTDLRLAMLETKDASYTSSQIMVAWDSYQHRGVVAMENLPASPAGHDYQLWVLDPAAEAPISAGLLTTSRPFTVQPVSTPRPGFAISLEPGGGSPEPTGPILFAVAPGP
jgi:anti-sigma-K factor RskA